jgi:hypothetical protein
MNKLLAGIDKRGAQAVLTGRPPRSRRRSRRLPGADRRARQAAASENVAQRVWAKDRVAVGRPRRAGDRATGSAG